MGESDRNVPISLWGLCSHAARGLTDELCAEADTDHGFTRGNCPGNQVILRLGVKVGHSAVVVDGDCGPPITTRRSMPLIDTGSAPWAYTLE